MTPSNRYGHREGLTEKENKMFKLDNAFPALLILVVGMGLGGFIVQRNTQDFILTQIEPPPFKTMTGYTYGPYLVLTAKPGVRIMPISVLKYIQADEASWRKPWDYSYDSKDVEDWNFVRH